jgi:hypothetical protein
VLIVAFCVAGRCGRRPAGLGLFLCAVNVTAQAFWDPNLGAPALVLLLPVLGFFFALGRIVRARSAAIDSLRRRTTELRHRREQTARLTVIADRARVSDDLDRMLRDRIAAIRVTAAAGRAALEADAARALDALLSIEREGREALRQMREIVGSLDDSAPVAPTPSLAELPALLARTTTAGTTLTVDGEPRRLPAGVELAGYRIAERLVAALEDAPGAKIDVNLRFGADAFELRVSGPPARGVQLDAVLAAVRERVSVLSGTIDDRLADGVYHATARLPLVALHA